LKNFRFLKETKQGLRPAAVGGYADPAAGNAQQPAASTGDARPGLV